MIGIQPIEAFNILLHFVMLVGLSICSAHFYLKAFTKNTVKIGYAICASFGVIAMFAVTFSFIDVILGFKV